ncbi:hypothetical protein SISSUDRAFT_984170, partial [Sistotremastrum suecicum HHB10207 ss-3]
MTSHQTALAFPVTISHVCRAWRSIAIGTANLWTTIQFTRLPSIHPSLMDYEQQRTWLTRSKGAPLHIHLVLNQSPKKEWNEEVLDRHWFSADDMDRVLDLIIPEAHRWSSAHVLTDSYAPMYRFLQRSSHIKAPILKDVELYRCNHFYGQSTEFHPRRFKDPFPLFESAEKLESVTLSGVHVDW